MSLTCRIHGALDLRLEHDVAAELRPNDVELRVGAGGIADLVDIVIEAAGSPAALPTCLTATRRGGCIVQVGTLPAEGVRFPAHSVMARELEYVGAFRAAHAFDWAVQALRSRRVEVRALISAQLPLARVADAFELALDRTRSTKVQLIAG